jgi:prostaglandin reductase 3
MTTYEKLTATRHSRKFREAVEILNVDLPETPAPDEMIIRNRYAGVNAADVMMAAGIYLVPTPVPCDLGSEAVGHVVAVGADVKNFWPGDDVLTNAIGCGYREYYVIKARRALAIPEATPEVMSLSISGLTASIALLETASMSQTGGETVLVTAAAGGTGQFAVQIAKLYGNHVIGTCSTDEKAAFLRSIGCDRVVNYREENLGDVLSKEYPRGVNIVFEGVGGEMFDIGVDHLARFGRLLTIGFISEYRNEEPERVNRARLYYKILAKNASVHGFNLNLYFGKPTVAEHMSKLDEMLRHGRLTPSIDPTPFSGVRGAIDAVEYLQSGANNGKVVVRMS